MAEIQMTEQEMDDIQEELNKHIRPLEEVDAELMALHFGFTTSHTIAVYKNKTEKEFREHVIMCLDKYLEGNPYEGNPSRRTQ